MNVLWLYGVHEQSGYARNSREFIKALNANDVPTRFLTLGHKDYPEKDIMKQWEAEEGFPYDIIIQNVVPPCFKRLGTKKNILMTFAETDSISPDWVKKCNEADEVWTTSYYSQAAFIHSGVRVPVRAISMPVDIKQIVETSKFTQTETLNELIKLRENSSFVFFANSEWTPRKGWDILLKSFYDVFADYEDIALIIKTCCFSNVESTTSILNQINSHKYRTNGKCPVMLINDIMDIREVWHIYKFADAFVLPSRGEGCGIPYLEAMSHGLPVICPSRGGQTDYLNDNLAVTVKSTLVPAYRFPHNPHYNETMMWIDTDSADLSFKMMNMVVNQDKEKWQVGADIFKQDFDYKEGKKIKETIEIMKKVASA